MSMPSAFVKVVKSSARKVKSYSESERKSHCENWRRSGLNMSQYCQQTGLAVSSLSTWLSAANKAAPLPLVSSVSPNKQSVKIVLANGIKLHVSEIAAVNEIVKLIQAVSLCH